MQKNNKGVALNKLRFWYGEWSARYGEGFFLYGAFSSALTSLWIVQNILKDSYQIHIPLYIIGIVFVVLFSAFVYLVDKLGFIEARSNAVAERNKYWRRIK